MGCEHLCVTLRGDGPCNNTNKKQMVYSSSFACSLRVRSVSRSSRPLSIISEILTRGRSSWSASSNVCTR